MNEDSLPSAWATARLRDVVTKLVDGSHNPPPAQADGLPMLSARNIEDDRVVWSTHRLIAPADFEREDSRTRVGPGDVLLTIVGTIGRAACVRSDERSFALQRSVAVLRPMGLEGRYLMYLIQSPAFARFLQDSAKGTAQKGVYLKVLGDAPVRVAPTAEQLRLIEALDSYLTRLDAGTEGLNRVEANLKRYCASVLKAAVEGRLVPTEAEMTRKEGRGHESGATFLARILKERRRLWEDAELAKMRAKGAAPKNDKWMSKYEEPAAPDTANLPVLPAGWCWATLNQLTWQVKDGPHFSPQYVDEGVPFITGGNVRPDGVDFAGAKRIAASLHDELCKRVKPAFGDVLYTKGGTTGIARVNTYKTEFSVWVHVAVLKLCSHVEPFYLQHALNSPWCYSQSQRFTHGVGNQDLGLTRMIHITVPLPPPGEQQRIVQEVDSLLSDATESETTVITAIKRLGRLRRSVLRWAFEGKLVDQDPNDEPASVLLDRIRRERLSTATGLERQPRPSTRRTA